MAPVSTINALDRFCKMRGYPSRSQALTVMVAEFMAREELKVQIQKRVAQFLFGDAPTDAEQDREGGKSDA